MPNVEFDEEKIGSGYPGNFEQNVHGDLVGFLMNKGLARDEKSANYLLLTLLVLVAISTITIWLWELNNDEVEVPEQFFSERAIQ